MSTPFVRPFPITLTLLLTLATAATALAGPLRGRVVDPDGQGVPGADVLLLTVNGAAVTAHTVTALDGRFTLTAPDTGDYEVRVAIDGFRATPVKIAGAAAEHDLGSIALEISAVSESLVVSAAQVEIPLSTVSSSVTVITREDLERHQTESVADALRAVPGFTVTANGGRGALTSVFPRGGESDYSLVFIDGIQANDFGGGFDFAHLPVANIERIEIVRGPQSALYGSNAIGSVIRVITRQGGPPTADASFEGGGFSTYRVTAATSGDARGWRWGAATEHLTTDNFDGQETASGATVENDDYARHSVSGMGGWTHHSGANVRGEVRYAQDERGNPGPFGSDPGGTYSGVDTVSRSHNERWQTSLGGMVPLGKVTLNASTTHAQVDSEFASPFGDSASASRRTTGRVQADASLARGLDGTAGVEFLGEQATGTFFTATGNVLVPVERGLAGFFAEARWTHAARLYVTGGLRVDRITRKALPGDADAFSPRPTFDDDTVVSANPRISAAWYVTSSDDGNFTKVRASAGTGIRPPDAFEIAFTDNPSLEPERSRSFDAGVDQALLRGRGLIEATAFFNNYDDLIVGTGSFTGTSPFRTDNVSNARARGLELAGSLRGPLGQLRGASLQVRVAYTFLDTEILAVDRAATAPPPYAVGDALLRRPTHQVSADVLLDAGKLTAFVHGGGRSAVRDVDPSFGMFGGVFDAPGYNVWDAGATWKLVTHLEVFGRITNLFDREYEEALGFPALGRSAMLGLRVAAGR